MVDLIASLSRLDASAFVAVLLVALLAALKWIGNGLINRIESVEKGLGDFEAIQAKHTTSLAVIKTRLDIVEEDIDQQ